MGVLDETEQSTADLAGGEPLLQIPETRVGRQKLHENKNLVSLRFLKRLLLLNFPSAVPVCIVVHTEATLTFMLSLVALLGRTTMMTTPSHKAKVQKELGGAEVQRRAKVPKVKVEALSAKLQSQEARVRTARRP